MKESSILITGVGAIIGQGIIRSLLGKDLEFRLVGIDANPCSVGFHWTEVSYTVPRTDDPDWLPSIIDICNREKVVLVLPGIEQDAKAFSQNLEEIRKRTKALPLLNSPEAERVGFDKWELYLFALAKNVKTPPTWLPTEEQMDPLRNYHYPLLLKPRKGMAGKGIYRLESGVDLKFWKERLPPNEYILQENIGTDDEEYTVSIFGFKNESLSEPFALKRRLSYGSTFEAETIFDSGLSSEVTRIANELKVVGPTNLQFRKVEKEYLLMEINPRFSSSTSIKSAFGFNEPLMAIKSFLYGKTEIHLELKTGRCSRYIEDYIVFK